MALSLNLHANLGTLEYPQVDYNFTQIQGAVNLLEASQIQNNFSATVDPTTSNNASQGYSNGSRWYNRTTPQLFVCVDAGAGTWVEETAVSGSLGSGAYSDVTVSATDTTAGRLLKVGDFGWGGVIENGLFDLNNAPIGSSITVNGTNTEGMTRNWPDLGGGSPVWWNVLTMGSGARITQIAKQAFATYGPRIFMRNKHDTTWYPWREIYHQASILGTVSQSAGVPTGALMEYGSNANGQFWRYAGNMQVFVIETTVDYTTTAAQARTNPASFAGPRPAWTVSGVSAVSGQESVRDISLRAGGGDITMYVPSSASGATAYPVTLTGISRWF